MLSAGRARATLYLGADVPLDAWRETASTVRPLAVVTTASRRKDVPRAALVVEGLAAQGAPPAVWVGGRYQHLVPPPARPLGHRIGDAATLLAGALTASERP